MMKLFQIICIALVQQVYAQQQSMETCNALDMMIANRNMRAFPQCMRNSLCTEITCINTIPIPGPSGTSVDTMTTTTITLLPCTTPFSIRAVSTGVGLSTPLLEVTLMRSANVTSSISSLGSTNFSLTQTPTGINLGVSSTVTIRGMALSTNLLPNTAIPLQCGMEMTPSTQQGMTTMATTRPQMTTTRPQMQSMETCNALDMMIANRNMGAFPQCTRNTLCTEITCTNTVSLPTGDTMATTTITLLPCMTPFSVRAVSIAEGLSTPLISATLTRSVNVTSTIPTLGSTNFTLTQMSTGINFGVSSTVTRNGMVINTNLLPNTVIPFQCDMQPTIGQTDSAFKMEALIGSVLASALIGTIYII